MKASLSFAFEQSTPSFGRCDVQFNGMTQLSYNIKSDTIAYELNGVSYFNGRLFFQMSQRPNCLLVPSRYEITEATESKLGHITILDAFRTGNCLPSESYTEKVFQIDPSHDARSDEFLSVAAGKYTLTFKNEATGAKGSCFERNTDHSLILDWSHID